VTEGADCKVSDIDWERCFEGWGVPSGFELCAAEAVVCLRLAAVWMLWCGHFN